MFLALWYLPDALLSFFPLPSKGIMGANPLRAKNWSWTPPSVESHCILGNFPTPFAIICVLSGVKCSNKAEPHRNGYAIHFQDMQMQLL